MSPFDLLHPSPEPDYDLYDVLHEAMLDTLDELTGADFEGPCAPAAASTPTIPSTPEKVAVLAERYRLRQSLWHPADPILMNGVVYQRAENGRMVRPHLGTAG